MIRAVCKACGHVFAGAWILGPVSCPKCQSKDVYTLVGKMWGVGTARIHP
jgi:predicted Zn-ribbon and HTH transcriptional regulator